MYGSIIVMIIIINHCQLRVVALYSHQVSIIMPPYTTPHNYPALNTPFHTGPRNDKVQYKTKSSSTVFNLSGLLAITSEFHGLESIPLHLPEVVYTQDVARHSQD